MNTKTLFDIQLKYLNIFKYLEDENLIQKTYFNNYEKLFEKHNNKELFIYPNIKIRSHADYVEIGNISKEEFETFDFKTIFNFKINADINCLTKWLTILYDHENPFHKHKCLKNTTCYIYSWEELKLKLSKNTIDNMAYSKEKKELIFEFEINFEYNFKTKTINN
jgi:hypothetical protein